LPILAGSLYTSRGLSRQFLGSRKARALFASRHGATLRVVTLGVSLFAAAVTVFAQTAGQDAPLAPEPSLTEAENAEGLRLLGLMDAALSREPVPSDIRTDLSWHFIRTRDGQVYVPFTLKLDPETVGQSVTIGVRLVPMGMVLMPPAAPEPGETGAERTPVEPPSYPFEDLHFVNLQPSQSGDYIVRRALMARPGSYDLYIGIKDSEQVETLSEEIRRGVVKRTVNVPDLWDGRLTTSSVIVLEGQWEEIPVPLSPAQQRSNPYSFGGMRLVPRDGLQYEKTETLSFLFFINNSQLVEDKPNVTVEYNFYQRLVGGEQFFNRSEPQTLSAETLPKFFNVAAGYPLSAGQNVPLSTFPEGVFRLEIEITDNEAATSISREVNFSIVGS